MSCGSFAKRPRSRSNSQPLQSSETFNLRLRQLKIFGTESKHIGHWYDNRTTWSHSLVLADFSCSFRPHCGEDPRRNGSLQISTVDLCTCRIYSSYLPASVGCPLTTQLTTASQYGLNRRGGNWPVQYSNVGEDGYMLYYPCFVNSSKSVATTYSVTHQELKTPYKIDVDF